LFLIAKQVYSLPSQEIAVRGFAAHSYFLVLYAYFFGDINPKQRKAALRAAFLCFGFDSP